MGIVVTQTVRKTIKKQSRLNVLRAANFSGMPWLTYGFSTRVGGFSRAYGKSDLNLGMTKDDSRAAVERNRSKFVSEVTAGAAPETWGNQTTVNQTWSGGRPRPPNVVVGDDPADSFRPHSLC